MEPDRKLALAVAAAAVFGVLLVARPESAAVLAKTQRALDPATLVSAQVPHRAASPSATHRATAPATAAAAVDARSLSAWDGRVHRGGPSP